MVIINHRTKGANHVLHVSLVFGYSPFSDASWQRITFPEYTILQFFLHNYSVTFWYK